MRMKTCTGCNLLKPLTEFPVRGAKRGARCKTCKAGYHQAWRRRNPNYMSSYHKKLWQTYPRREAIRKFVSKTGVSITLADWEALHEAQGGVCAICKKPSLTKALAIDHCHQTLKVRGLLCESCNNGLGRFRDDVELLESAITYLKKV